LRLLRPQHHPLHCFFFVLPAPATTAIYTLSLHDALPIFPRADELPEQHELVAVFRTRTAGADDLGDAWRGRRGHVRTVRGRCVSDRKSTRLNSSHRTISYAVFCLKKKRIRNQR